VAGFVGIGRFADLLGVATGTPRLGRTVSVLLRVHAKCLDGGELDVQAV
jgi:hypothetical protein